MANWKEQRMVLEAFLQPWQASQGLTPQPSASCNTDNDLHQL